jgi:hypothetical protein
VFGEQLEENLAERLAVQLRHQQDWGLQIQNRWVAKLRLKRPSSHQVVHLDLPAVVLLLARVVGVSHLLQEDRLREHFSIPGIRALLFHLSLTEQTTE